MPADGVSVGDDDIALIGGFDLDLDALETIEGVSHLSSAVTLGRRVLTPSPKIAQRRR